MSNIVRQTSIAYSEEGLAFRSSMLSLQRSVRSAPEAVEISRPPVKFRAIAPAKSPPAAVRKESFQSGAARHNRHCHESQQRAARMRQVTRKAARKLAARQRHVQKIFLGRRRKTSKESRRRSTVQSRWVVDLPQSLDSINHSCASFFIASVSVMTWHSLRGGACRLIVQQLDVPIRNHKQADNSSIRTRN